MQPFSMTRGARAFAAGLIGLAISFAALAQAPTPSVSPSAAVTPSAAATPAAPPSPSAAAAQAPGATPSPSPTPLPAATPAPSPAPAPAPSATPSTGQILELAPRPAATLEGKASRDEVFSAIMGSLATIRTEIAKAGLKANGRPMAAFLTADDTGFTYRAMVPLESAPEGKSQLADNVMLGLTPAGKAMKFEHRGAYDDIDATYEAITAYLDEKGVDALDVFVEEYLNETKTGDDPNLQVDIYVLLK